MTAPWQDRGITPGDRNVPKTNTLGDIVGKVIAFLILAFVFLFIVVPLMIGIARWTWGWALDDEHVPTKPPVTQE